MIPRATLRLQFHRGFTFRDAEALVPYFAQLGVSHLYASPIAVARLGSMHGYDVIDPTRVNPELGGEAALRSLSDALTAAGLGLIVVSVNGQCPPLSEIGVTCVTKFSQVLADFGLMVGEFSLNTGFPIVLAVGGLIFLVALLLVLRTWRNARSERL